MDEPTFSNATCSQPCRHCVYCFRSPVAGAKWLCAKFPGSWNADNSKVGFLYPKRSGWRSSVFNLATLPFLSPILCSTTPSRCMQFLLYFGSDYTWNSRKQTKMASRAHAGAAYLSIRHRADQRQSPGLAATVVTKLQSRSVSSHQRRPRMSSCRPDFRTPWDRYQLNA